ncbi:MAG: hypothetical protein RL226_340 [Bacteroidota bacterium]
MTKYVVFALLSAAWIQTTGQVCPDIQNFQLPDSLSASCNECVIIDAPPFEQFYESTSYTVESVPWNGLPYPTNTGTAVVGGIDDTWSTLIPMGFSFCFYNTAYSNIVIGSNGVVTFDASDANGFCPWSYTAALPSAALPNNAIFCPYHDIDPSECGTVRYQMYGEAPCRTFVVSFAGVCMYSCTSLQTTSQLVLYESSNIIEVYVANKPTCAWNNGNTLIGLQNAASNASVTPPGRNTGNWSASNEAWRFNPNGSPVGELTWVADNEIIGTGPSLQYCPDSASTVYAVLNYNFCTNAVNGDNCANYTINVTSGTWPGEVSWNLLLGGQVFASGGAPFNQQVCLPNGCYTLQMLDSFGDGWNGSVFTLSYQGTNLGTANLPSGSNGNATICVNEFVEVDPGDPDLLDGFLVDSVFVDVIFDDITPGLLTPDPACSYDDFLQLEASLPDGLWESTCTSCISENGLFDITASGAGTYFVFYTIEGACGPVTETTEVVIIDPPAVQIQGPAILCEFDEAVIFNGGTSGGLWSADCGDCIDSQTGEFSPLNLSPGTYIVSYIAGDLCVASDDFEVTIPATLTATIVSPDVMCEESSQQLSASIEGGIWSASCGNCINNDGVFNGQISGDGIFEITYTFDGECAVPNFTTVEVIEAVSATISLVPTLCESGDDVQLTTVDQGGVWFADCGECLNSNGLFSPSLAGEGVYVILYEIEGICSDSDATTIEVLGQTDATITLDEGICLDAGTVFAVAPSPGGVWSASCGGCIDPSSGEIDLTLAEPGALEVQYVIDGLCGSADETVSELFPCSVEVPNIFTPNDDGINDFLVFTNLEYFPASHLVVFNRWGGTVFEDNAYNNNWRAEGVVDGHYLFILTIGGQDKVEGAITITR